MSMIKRVKNLQNTTLRSIVYVIDVIRPRERRFYPYPLKQTLNGDIAKAKILLAVAVP